MKIILSDGHARRDSEPLIAHVAAYLGRFGVGVERVRIRKQPRRPYDHYAALIANAEFPVELRSRLDCFGKTSSEMPSRPETLRWLHEAGLPVMRWDLARDPAELLELFERWGADALLVKRSGTSGGTSVSIFTREHVQGLEWEPAVDLFCPEVNPDDGDIYKLELFGREVLIGWMSRAPTARSRMEGGRVDGIYGAYGRREPFDWPESVLAPARAFGARMLERGYGHISLDLMRSAEGTFEVIEVNLGNVAIWWSCQFGSFRDRYARAIHELLVERHGASSSPAPLSERVGFLLPWLVQKPKLAMREVQGARWRRRTSREQEARYGAPPPAGSG